VLVASLILLIVAAPGCSESAYSAGYTMSQRHIAAGCNPSPERRMAMQAELDRTAAPYSCADKQESLKGYLEGVSKAMQKELDAAFSQAMRNMPQHARR
jgi:hypothetical protein